MSSLCLWVQLKWSQHWLSSSIELTSIQTVVIISVSAQLKSPKQRLSALSQRLSIQIVSSLCFSVPFIKMSYIELSYRLRFKNFFNEPHKSTGGKQPLFPIREMHLTIHSRDVELLSFKYFKQSENLKKQHKTNRPPLNNNIYNPTPQYHLNCLTRTRPLQRHIWHFAPWHRLSIVQNYHPIRKLLLITKPSNSLRFHFFLIFSPHFASASHDQA